ncbi:craniofacial development protein 2-like [Antennarius striatus]|uniref:craniofacial development protein 2-like n=1 Tax=Antennarius striatus TaxID=241820 RepID=UPI0035AF1EEC
MARRKDESIREPCSRLARLQQSQNKWSTTSSLSWASQKQDGHSQGRSNWQSVISSRHEDEGAINTEEVAIMMMKDARKALTEWKPINSRIMSATFNTSNRRVKTHIIQCYAPINNVDDEVKAIFYDSLNHQVNVIKARDLVILRGDFNAKIGGQNNGYETVMRKQGVGTMDENGEMFEETCVNTNIVIGGSVFPHKTIHKTTWVSPGHVTDNQISHISNSKKFRRVMKYVRTGKGADETSDHHLLIGKFKLRLKTYQQAKRQRMKYNTEYLSNGRVTKHFQDIV